MPKTIKKTMISKEKLKKMNKRNFRKFYTEGYFGQTSYHRCPVNFWLSSMYPDSLFWAEKGKMQDGHGKIRYFKTPSWMKEKLPLFHNVLSKKGEISAKEIRNLL